MDKELVIKVDQVSKDFKLPHLRANSVKSLFTGTHKKNTATATETQHALRDISFEVYKGEFFGIVGRNGSGKSTLLKILASIYQPSKGSVSVKGKLVPFIELGVGFNGELTGRENVYLNGAMLGFSRKELDKIYDDIVEFAELERFMDQKLKNYSSGMQVRLAFSMATRAEADILLVDEVLAVGDADFQRKCFDYFKSLKKNKKTVVFVSHDMSAVRQYCDRVILIEKNEIVARGSAAEIAAEYTRMFNAESSSEVATGKTKTRWGNNKARINSVVITPAKISAKSETLNIKVDITATEKTRNLVLGFVIKDSAGHDITGTNTRLENMETGNWDSGKVRRIVWTVPNVFTDGKYTVDVAALEEDTTTVCDWWEGAGRFTSYEDNLKPYIVSPNIITDLGD